MKTAITGATGQLGRLVIQALLKKTTADHIVALVRDEQKAQDLQEQGLTLRHFDYDEPAHLVDTLQGIDQLLLISANEIGRRTPQHQAVIMAAQQAGVKHIVYTSLLHADRNPLGLAQEHRETEALILASGLTFTFLRNNWYSENYLANVTHAVETGVLYGSAEQGKISSASRQDYAEAAAQVLASAGHSNKTYELAGSDSYSLSDLADYISQAAHKTVVYQNLSAENYSQALNEAGLPSALVDVIVDADLHAAQGAMYSQSQDLQQLLGRKTTSIQEQVRAIFDA